MHKVLPNIRKDLAWVQENQEEVIVTSWNTIKNYARELRKNPTPAENLLWKHLRKRQLLNCKFLRQYPIVYKQRNRRRFFFIADFYCSEKKLVIELDGKIHDFKKNYDYNRDLVLSELQLTTLRIRNEELKNIEKVKEQILYRLLE